MELVEGRKLSMEEGSIRMTETVCPACRLAIPPGQEGAVRFCPYCGAALGPAGEWETSAAEGEGRRLLAELRAAYLNGIAAAKKGLKPKGIGEWLIGFGSRQNNAVTDRFIKDTGDAAETLARELTLRPDGDVARDAVEFILLGVYEQQEDTHLLLTAAERGALALIPFVREEDRALLGQRYLKKHKKTGFLPVQKMISKALTPQKGKK